MQTLGLNAAEFAAYVATLRFSHRRRVRVDVTDLEGNVLSRLGDNDGPVRLLDGQVVADRTAEVTRAASLTFFDPSHDLKFDTASPHDGVLFLDRMVRITYGVFVESLGRWVNCVVFHGPVTQLSRDVDQVSIEAQGKEALANGDFGSTMSFNKMVRKTDVIKRIMRERAGENRFSIPDLPATIPAPVNVPRNYRYAAASQALSGSTPWAAAKKLADSLDRQLFYDGRGVLVLREYPGNTAWTFRHGEGGDVVTPVKVSYTASIKNTVIVTGRKPKNAKKAAPRVRVSAPNSTGLSPTRLGRNGVPRHLIEEVQSDSVTSTAQARKLAERLLDDRLRAGIEVSFDALPIPFLDLGDICRVNTGDASFSFRLNQFTLPLAAGPMTVGYTARPRPRRSRIR